MALCRRTVQESDVESDWFEPGVQWPSVRKKWKKKERICNYISILKILLCTRLFACFFSASMLTLMAIQVYLSHQQKPVFRSSKPGTR